MIGARGLAVLIGLAECIYGSLGEMWLIPVQTA
jgi:hypothetical protein